MMWRDVVSLRNITSTIDEYGDRTETGINSVVFANKKSVRQSEFYQAHAHGFKPEIMFEVRSLEYTGQEQLIYNGKTYNIIRTYSKNDEVMELICSSLARGL